MMKIRYSICIALCAAVFAGCASNGGYVPAQQDDEMIAVRLSATGKSVQVTRAGIDPSLTSIYNATLVVFAWDGTNDNTTVWSQTRTIDYAGGERLYLRPGSYKIFAVANLDDSWCPNGNAATYLDDVTTIAGLESKYILAASPLGPNPGKVPMITGTTSTPIAEITIDSPVTTATTTIELELRSLYTKMSINIYNRTDAAGTVQSGVAPQGYYTENLPTASYLVEQASDYAYTNTLYAQSALVTPLPATDGQIYEFTQQPGNYYNKRVVDVYCLENRRGDVTVTDAHDRRDDAPEYATATHIMSTVTGQNNVLDTYIYPGKGRTAEANDPDTDDIGNYDVDRNSIYHINVIINGTAEITVDSRREYLERLVCGTLTPPVNGNGADF